MKLSLIVPVYNVEKYIEACLKSIAVQLPQNDIEIIIINDGSPDRSMELITDFLSSYDENIKKSFKIIEQSNQGVSVARNRGIAEAQGKYLAFLDSDDFLDSTYLENILKVIDNFSPDIIKFEAQRIDQQGRASYFLKPLDLDGLYNLNRDIWLKESNQCAWFPWLRIYKAEFFKKNLFPVGMRYVEDAYTIPYILLEAKNIYYLNKSLVFYRFNSESATAIESVANVEDLKKSIYKMLNYLKEEPVLSASIISLSQNYIKGSVNTEGLAAARSRWSSLRHDITKNNGFDKSCIRNRGNKLFFNFGIIFLLLCKVLKK